MATPLGKIITRDWMTGMDQPAQILFPTTEIGESVKYSMGIANPFRTDTENQREPTIKPTIVQFKQETGPGHIYRNHFPLRILDSGTDITRYGRNIDNHTGMNPWGPNGTIIPESNRANNCKNFDFIRRILNFSYRGSLWHDTEKGESEKLGGNKFFEDAERENNFEVEKVGRQNYVIWNHKDSKSTHFDTNQTNYNQPITSDFTNIRSIHYSSDIHAI